MADGNENDETPPSPKRLKRDQAKPAVGTKATDLRAKPSGRPVSYGVLLYKNAGCSKTEYLLGLIPQRNFWTVFKGMPEPDEMPEQTALREFCEETGCSNDILPALSPVATIKGRVGKKKDLVIFLQEGSCIQESMFDVEKVVKIDQGYMMGQPEIVRIKWMTSEQALKGVEGAKIYNSQESIIKEAEQIIPKLEEDKDSE